MDSLLKRTGALMLSVVLAQWVLLPACPCQLQGLFGSAAEPAERPDAGAESIAVMLGGGHGKLCCCDGHGIKTAHGSSPEVPAPKATVTPATDGSFVAGHDVPPSEDTLQSSGTDPPPPEALRLHLRWQVFLV